MMIDGRLSDALNKREPIEIDRRPVGARSTAPSRWSPRPVSRSVDPYDLVVVIAGDDSLPDMTEDGKAAHKRPQGLVRGRASRCRPTASSARSTSIRDPSPTACSSRSSEMFVPIVDATATMGDRRVGPEAATAVLVNRQYIRGVEQVDRPDRRAPRAAAGRAAGRDELD